MLLLLLLLLLLLVLVLRELLMQTPPISTDSTPPLAVLVVTLDIHRSVPHTSTNSTSTISDAINILTTPPTNTPINTPTRTAVVDTLIA